MRSSEAKRTLNAVAKQPPSEGTSEMISYDIWGKERVSLILNIQATCPLKIAGLADLIWSQDFSTLAEQLRQLAK
jgi:hypothetical protein